VGKADLQAALVEAAFDPLCLSEEERRRLWQLDGEESRAACIERLRRLGEGTYQLS